MLSLALCLSPSQSVFLTSAALPLNSQLSQSVSCVFVPASQVHQGGLDWLLRRRQVQSPLQVHQERVQPRVQVHHWCRVRHQNPQRRQLANRSSRPRFGTLLAKKGTTASLLFDSFMFWWISGFGVDFGA
ncbi:hypothetical protein ABKV19_004547 [Rosa sericea]